MAALTLERPEVQLEQDVLAWADAVYQEADTDLMASPEAKHVQRIIDYLEGMQWNPKTRGRSRPVINRVVRQFVEMASLLTDIQPDITVRFMDVMDNFSEIEKLMNVMLDDWARMSSFERDLLEIVMYGLIMDGPTKVQWNPTLRGGLGDCEILALSPLDFLQIGSAGRLQEEAEVCIVRRVVTKPWLVRRFGEVAEAVQPDVDSDVMASPQKPNTMSSRRWQRLSPIVRNIHSKLANSGSAGSVTRIPKCIYKEFWLRDDSIWNGSESIIIGNPRSCWSYRVEPGMPKYPRGRVIVVAGGKVLEDAPNPYWHSKFPFAIYRPLQVPWKWNGLSVLSPMVAIQAVLNRMDGGIVDAVLQSVDPPFMGPMAAFSEQDKDSIDPNAPGTKIWYRNNSPRPPERAKPIEFGNYVTPTVDRLEKELAMSSGSAAINQAMQKKQIPGGDSLDMIMNSRAVNIRLYGRALQFFLEDVGSMVVANKLQFETADKRIQQYGWKGLMDSDFEPYYKHLCPKGMRPEEFVRKCLLTIRRGSLLAIERTDELAQMSALRKAGEIDHQTFLEYINSKFNANLNIEQISQRLAVEAEQKAKLAIAMGAAQHEARAAERGKK